MKGIFWQTRIIKFKCITIIKFSKINFCQKIPFINYIIYMPFENDLFKKKYLKYKKKYIDLKNSGMRGGGWTDTSVTPSVWREGTCEKYVDQSTSMCNTCIQQFNNHDNSKCSTKKFVRMDNALCGMCKNISSIHPYEFQGRKF